MSHWFAALALGCLLGSGCGSGSSGQSSALAPAVAQVAPTTQTPVEQALVLGGLVQGRTGETFDLSLEVAGGTVGGHAVLSRGGDNFVPYVVDGLLSPDNRAVLTLYPYDVSSATDSFEVSGSLAAGESVVLRQTGAANEYGRVALSDRNPSAPKVWNHNGEGGQEVYELQFTSSVPRKQGYGYRLTFTEGGAYYRRGTFEPIGSSATTDGRPPDPPVNAFLQDTAVQANFYVFEPTLVRLDFYGYLENRNRVLVKHNAGSIYIRTNSNSFFGGGFPGSSVGLEPDSFLKVSGGDIFSDGQASLKLVSGGS